VSDGSVTETTSAGTAVVGLWSGDSTTFYVVTVAADGGVGGEITCQ
jgi:hypothetical protein